jgi:hypothetical protein
MSVNLGLPAWTPPWPSEGHATFARVSASSLSGDNRWICAEQVAKKARPQISPVREASTKAVYPPYEDVPIGMVRDALYDILAKGVDIDRAIAAREAEARRTIADPTRTVLRAGIEGYLATLAELGRAGDLPTDTVVREFAAIDSLADSDPSRLEWYGWGLMHTSRDSAIREYHLLTWSRAGSQQRSAASLGVYARIAADAVNVLDTTAWWEPRVESSAQPRPGHEVRIREIGLLDGSTALCFADSVDAAREYFTTHVPAAMGVLAGGSYQPTARCASCTLRNACPGVPRMPGVLGVIGQSTWPRSFSPSDLSHGRHCTYQVHLGRTLGLPGLRGEPTEAMMRGSDVHAWLEFAHARREPCTPDDLPVDELSTIAAELGWSMQRYLARRPYLISHLDTCALTRYDCDAAFPETTLGAWDTDVDVVMSTRADLVIADGEHVVVRETKTVYDTDDTLTDSELLQRYPQVALTVCLLADGLDALTGELVDPPRPARVELEFLTLDRSHVRTFDATDAETVVIARSHIAEALDRLLYDTPEPAPGPWCSWCPVSRWCSATTLTDDGHWVDPGETSEPMQPLAQGTRTALLALAETAGLDDDDDIPF